MNTQLVQTLAKVILSLSDDEKNLLQTELQPKNNWQYHIEKIKEHRMMIDQRRQGKTFEISIDDIFAQMRQERSEHLLLTNISENKNEQ